MAKMRRGVSKKRGAPSKSSKMASTQQKRLEQRAGTDTLDNDKALFSSSVRAYILSALFLVLAMLFNGGIPPFNEIHKFNDVLGGILNGVFSLLFFLFLLIAWGNSLEIHGDVLGWKQIIVGILMTVAVTGWGGTIAMLIAVGGIFLILAMMYYLNP